MTYIGLFLGLGLGLMFIILGFVFKAFPPKTLNHLYGYRTSMSMKNEDTWQEANAYANRLLIYIGFFVVIFVLVYHWVAPPVDVMVVGILVGIVSVFIIILTERHLKNMFDAKGKRK